MQESGGKRIVVVTLASPVPPEQLPIAEWDRVVRVNAVSPGFTRSPALQAKIDSGERDVTVIEKATALRRLMKHEDSAYAVAFLLSDEASGITGVNLPVEGGWLVMPSWQSYPGIRGDWP